MTAHRIRWYHFGGLVLMIAFVLAAIVFVRATSDMVQARRDVALVRQTLSRAGTEWRNEGMRALPRIAEELRDAEDAIQRTHALLTTYRPLGVVPLLGEDVVFATQMTTSAATMITAARQMVAVAQDGALLFDQFRDRSPRDLTLRERTSIAFALTGGITRMRVGVTAIAQELEALSRLRCPRFAARAVTCTASGMLDVEGVFGSTLQEFRGIEQRVAAALRSADALASLVGAAGPTDVLVLLQNNTELRPSGGFLGTYGLMTVHHGEIVRMMTDDVYTLDRAAADRLHIAPPEPFRRYGIAPWWFLRDANWSPDFFVSATQVLDFYRREGGPGSPTIVIGITPTFASALLRIVGPVTIQGVRFTPEHIADELDFQVEVAYARKGIPTAQRKAIIAPLTQTVVDRLSGIPFRSWGPVLESVRTAVQERHLVIAAVHPQIQEALDAVDVTGRVRPLPVGTDGLLVVDANLGSLKTDPFVERSYRYSITPAGSGYRGRLDLRYRNTGTFTWKTSRYRTYARMYLPQGTHIREVRGAMQGDRSGAPGTVDQSEEFDRMVVGAFLSVEPGTARTLTIEFDLAPAIVQQIRSGRYTLVGQKQLGTIATPLTLDLRFGTPVRAASPPEVRSAWGDDRYVLTTDLRIDRTWNVRLDSATLPSAALP
ncbi:DUF4012 domain-containing protein [Candidatus Uhrbacteria bacterium]|nr:DUF4012 domain-containing protein [Candidatus Uhrbacteria bacterium]